MSEPVLGIDLGTSNSVVATVEDGVPLVIPSRAGGLLTPSMVAAHEGQYLVGRAAKDLLNWHPQRVATATKRYIGQRFSPELALAHTKLPYRLVGGPTGDVRVSLEGNVLPLTQVSALVLGELYLDAQRYFGFPVKKAVITVPANFDDGQRQATKEAARIAGFELLRIINEPTAAALAFGMARKFKGRVLVFDLGGGTLDVTALEVSDGVFEVKATGGDPQLGGEDFDGAIMEWVLGQLTQLQRAALERDPVLVRRLRTAAEKAKQDLTLDELAQVDVSGIGEQRDGVVAAHRSTLERRVFDELSAPLWGRCLAVCDLVLREARLTPADLDAVLLVGGMTRAPRIRQLLTQHLGREPEYGVSPDEVVAVGAAIQAAQIGATGGETLLLDVASQSLGVGFATQRVRRLIAKNAAIPTRAQQCFHPLSAKQSEAVIPIFQGESDFAAECTRLGEVRLTGLGGIDRSDQPILVSFELAADGTLSVSAQHPHTGELTTLEIDSRTDLSAPETGRLKAEQVERMVLQTIADKAASFSAMRQMLEELDEVLAAEEGSAWGANERQAIERMAAVAREALAAEDWKKVAALARGLPRLVKAARRQAGVVMGEELA